MCYPGALPPPPNAPPATKPADEYLCRKDEEVTCTNDHVICMVKRDFKRKSFDWPQFYRWRDPEPMPGTMPPILCCRCGAPWFSEKHEIHFKDGWRGPA